MEKASVKEILNGHDDSKYVTPRGLKKFLLEQVYPVGAIYISVNATEPGMLFGGEWQLLKDRFLLGAGGSYSNGATGGEATHKLTKDEMPTHSHAIDVSTSTNSSDGGGSYGIQQRLSHTYSTSQIPERTTSNNWNGVLVNGGDKAHNNMPPYLVVYMWKRVK